MAVAEEMVGMQAAAGRWMEQSAATEQLLLIPLPSECPSLAHPKGSIPKEGIQSEIQRGLRASVTVAKATLLGRTRGCSAGVSPAFPCHDAVPALLSHHHQQQSWGHPALT